MILTCRQLRIFGLSLGWLLTIGCGGANAQDDGTQALQTLRSEIRLLEDRLASRQAEREVGLLALKEAELGAATAAGALRDVREHLASQLARQQGLREDTRLAGVRLDRERGALAEQVLMSYVAGRQEMLKLLLNQENPARLGRMVVYFDYLNRARSQRLVAVEAEIETSMELATESAQVARELGRLEQMQADELEVLEFSRNERRSVLAKLEQDIATSAGDIRQLRDEEQRLEEIFAELEASVELFPLEGAGSFPSIKGELAWPVSGSLVSDFGQARASGQLRWNGVVVAAPGGTLVRAVYYGRVAYADWLPGLGLLIIVDHGAGYMSLYGHNEALLKASDGWVAPGDVIAHVGDSGGQTRTALYFEIRHNGEPIDPRPWMGRDLGAAP
ncbi:MAG: peptidoglycan DD-metalloendopeptidase family protein [Gammaproteobacteria bacterium]